MQNRVRFSVRPALIYPARTLGLENTMHASPTQELACSPLSEHYREVRQTTLNLARPYSAEDQMLQSMPDASPVKWHLAHTTWFFETFILAPNASGYRAFDQRYQHLFNSYYKQLGSHPYRGARGLMSRPSLDEVHAYRSHVDGAMRRHLEVPDERTAALIELGLNHEQQHQELILTDIKHALWSMPLRPGRVNQPRPVSPAVPLQWMYFEGGIHKIGHGLRAGLEFSAVLGTERRPLVRIHFARNARVGPCCACVSRQLLRNRRVC